MAAHFRDKMSPVVNLDIIHYIILM